MEFVDIASGPTDAAERITILVVEDDHPTRGMVKELMEMQQFKVLEARDGAEAHELFLQHRNKIMCLVTDIIMPKMTGCCLHEKIWESAIDLPTVFISGYPEEIMSHLDLSQKRAVFLSKPFKPSELLEAVRSVISNSCS